MMRFLIRYDLTGEQFEVTGDTCDECRVKADAECEQRGWSVELVGSEKVEARNG